MSPTEVTVGEKKHDVRPGAEHFPVTENTGSYKLWFPSAKFKIFISSEVIFVTLLHILLNLTLRGRC